MPVGLTASRADSATERPASSAERAGGVDIISATACVRRCERLSREEDMGSDKVILVTGASSGFGALMVRALADAGHTVYAGMRDIVSRNAEAAQAARAYADAHGVALRPVEMDVADQNLVDQAVAAVLDGAGHIDVVIHNAGHMVLGPTEAFTPEQVATVYDTNVLSTQRVNRAVLPHMRGRGDGLVVWIGSSSSRGGTPPYLGPYFAAKAAEDALAVSYAAELTRFGIETTIVVPGSFTSGTNHFANAGHAADSVVATAYEAKYAGLMDGVSTKLAEMAPDDADPGEVATQVVRVVDLPKGKRPFRVYIDPADDGAEDVFRIGDRVRQWFYQRIGLSDLLSVTSQPAALLT
jgi:NAD(P)-dependent dehydrogenase (short-subunit alcohol dehydrogenase family)